VNTLLNIVIVGLLMACSNTPVPQRSTTPVSGSEAMQPVSSDSMVPVPNQDAPLNSPPENPISLQATPQLVNTTPQADQTQTAPGMNPPHGQPNHRCGIPVGAPLNSSPGNAPSIQATPQLVNTTPQADQTQTAPGMNPPHGQPNHRCGIPVGAPLNSSPPGNAPSIQATPPHVNLAPQADQTQTASGMNPPHGQPNHRCGIPVGAPLNSTPGNAPVFPQTSGSSTQTDSPKPADPPKAF
jgi:hypothetical protein